MEVKVTSFIAEHNILLVVADHLRPLFRDIFHDSKIAKNYACGKTKTTCILNRAIKPKLQNNVINQMKKDCYSISTDGSNNQGLKKMHPVTVRLFDIYWHMVVNQFLEMCLSSSSDADGIIMAIDKAFANNGIPWDKCISLGVDNTSVNIGKHHSLITKAREKNDEIILMECPCHMAHNATHHATKAFEKFVIFNAEELLIDLCFHFDYSSKRKNLILEFCAFISKS